ncbi:DUF1835 domain-containing protein [Solibacillus silvestris]|uniref:DUF1835 domain-containing protein n=1 Tax=Solibacillus silvestris TaxID=76853 RepID=UPI003F7F8A77
MDFEMKIKELKEAIGKLPEREAKSLLFHILLKLEISRGTDYLEKKFISELEEIYEPVFDIERKRAEMPHEQSCRMVHIVFGLSGAGSLKMALKIMKVHKWEQVIIFGDIFSIGPIERLHEDDGQEARVQWLKNAVSMALAERVNFQVSLPIREYSFNENCFS